MSAENYDPPVIIWPIEGISESEKGSISNLFEDGESEFGEEIMVPTSGESKRFLTVKAKDIGNAIKKTAENFHETVNKINEKAQPDELEVTFSIGFSKEMNCYVINGSATTEISVKLKWKKST